MDERLVILVPSDEDTRADQREYWNNFVYRVRTAIERDSLKPVIVAINPDSMEIVKVGP